MKQIVRPSANYIAALIACAAASCATYKGAQHSVTSAVTVAREACLVAADPESDELPDRSAREVPAAAFHPPEEFADFRIRDVSFGAAGMPSADIARDVLVIRADGPPATPRRGAICLLDETKGKWQIDQCYRVVDSAIIYGLEFGAAEAAVDVISRDGRWASWGGHATPEYCQTKQLEDWPREFRLRVVERIAPGSEEREGVPDGTDTRVWLDHACSSGMVRFTESVFLRDGAIVGTRDQLKSAGREHVHGRKIGG